MKSNEKVIDTLTRDNDKFIDDELRPFLRIPSMTHNKRGILEAKDFILSFII